MPQARTQPRPARAGATEVTRVGWDTLRGLAGFRARNGCAVSLYMDLDPHVSPTAVQVQTRMRALVDEAHKRAEASRDRRTHAQQASLREALEQIQRWFEAEFNRDGVRGLAVFTAPRDDLWSALRLPVSVTDVVRFGSDLYVAPLVPLAAEGSPSLVAFVGRERGDVYELRDGRVEALASRFEEQPRRHGQGGRSQANYQRHVDSLAERHLRAFVEELERVLRRRPGAKLVIACAEETRSELVGLLSGDARAALVGWVRAEAHASGAELLAAVKPVLERHRPECEAELVARWHDALGESGRACAGWAPTLDAASDGRIDALLYTPSASQDINRCPSCGRLQLESGACPLDGAELEQCDDGLDALVHQTLARGGRAQAITTQRDLGPVGGVAALLRF
jgi:peptide chain release factor subunit 1